MSRPASRIGSRPASRTGVRGAASESDLDAVRPFDKLTYKPSTWAKLDVTVNDDFVKGRPVRIEGVVPTPRSGNVEWRREDWDTQYNFSKRGLALTYVGHPLGGISHARLTPGPGYSGQAGMRYPTNTSDIFLLSGGFTLTFGPRNSAGQRETIHYESRKPLAVHLTAPSTRLGNTPNVGHSYSTDSVYYEVLIIVEEQRFTYTNCDYSLNAHYLTKIPMKEQKELNKQDVTRKVIPVNACPRGAFNEKGFFEGAHTIHKDDNSW